jgi:hypothetical protein
MKGKEKRKGEDRSREERKGGPCPLSCSLSPLLPAMAPNIRGVIPKEPEIREIFRSLTHCPKNRKEKERKRKERKEKEKKNKNKKVGNKKTTKGYSEQT